MSGIFVRKNIRDREHEKFREASGDLTKVAVSIEQSISEPVPVSFTELGEPLNVYDEAPSVAGLATETIIDYTVPALKGLDVKHIHISGENKSVFTIEINSVIVYKHRIWFTKFSDNIETTIRLQSGDNLKVIVENKSNSISDFNSTITGNIYNAWFRNTWKRIRA